MVKPDSKNFDERNVDEMPAQFMKALICVAISTKLFEGTYYAWWLYFERLKFGDLIPIP